MPEHTHSITGSVSAPLLSHRFCSPLPLIPFTRPFVLNGPTHPPGEPRGPGGRSWGAMPSSFVSTKEGFCHQSVI